jgi:thiamine transport system permease protein
MRQTLNKHRHCLRYLAFSLPLLFLLFFFLYPLGAILLRSFLWSDLPVLPNLGYLARVLWFTLWQATASTLLTLFLGLPGTTVPFVLPTLIVATALSSLIGPNGVVNTALMRIFRLDAPPLDLQHTIWIVLLAHVFYNYSVIVRVVGSFWATLNPRLEEAARALGASRWRAWREITLPQLMPAIAAAALLTFLFCFTSFGVVMILGGPRLATVEVEIYRQAVHLLNLPLAATLSLIQLFLTFSIMSVYTALQRRTARPLDYRSRQATQVRPTTWHARGWVAANVVLMIALLLIPLSALVWRSFTLGGAFTVRYYQALWQDPGRSIFFTPPPTAIRNSLLFALAAVALSLVLGTLSGYLLASRDALLQRVVAWLDPLFVLPLGASAVTLGFGYLITFGRPPLDWITSPLLVPIVHALIAFPFVLRSVLPALRGIRPSLGEAAATLGASPARVWWAVDLPLIARPLAVGAVYGFTISVGEFGATLLIARAEYATIPVTLYRYLSQPGQVNVGQALAMSVLLMLLCAISFLLIERFRIGEIGSF